MIGRALSHYKILEKLGSGGMGDVYVAEDTKLDRRVALKILPPEYASNDERRERFEREAKAVAALNHPHIVTLHSVEEAEGIHFITMELVKGKTLTELISKKALPLTRFLDLAIPLADAVSAAHERGIIHRDLKPDNLMVGDDGRLKILDFGLAKLKQEYVDSGISDLPTQPQTQEGRILGTVAYMSPEQAEGKPVDHRSDIFSLGIILYEMATGQRPFQGDTTASVLSSIIKDTPASATEVNPGLPRDLGKIIRRCLVKDPTRRYQTALDLRNELEELKHDVDSGEVLDQAPAAASKAKRNWFLHAALVVAVVILGIIAYQMRLGEVTDEATESPSDVTLVRVTSQPGQELFPTLSPDGEFFAYASRASGNWDIYLQRIEGEKAINLTSNSVQDDTMPAFSPDGRQIAFRSEREGGGLFLMGATGESVRRLTDNGYIPTWSPDGSCLAYVNVGNWRPAQGFTRGQLWIVDLSTGNQRLLIESARQASWSPGGHRIAYWAITGGGLRDIWTIPVVGGKATAVTNDSYVDWNPVWSPDGKYLYFSSDRGGSMNLWRVRVDEESGNVLEPPEAVTTGGAASRHHLSFSLGGTRATYVEEVTFRNIWKAALDLTTGVTGRNPAPITEGSKRSISPAVSPGGKWIAYMTADEQEDIFVMRVDGTERRQLTNDQHNDRSPRWSPDGRRISFYSNRTGSYEIWTIRRDGSDLVQHTDTPGQSVSYPSWSPDGSRMAYYSSTSKKSYIFDMDKTWEGQVPVTLPPFEGGQEPFTVYSWSADGRHIAGWTRSPDGSPTGIVIFDLESKQYKRLTDSGIFPVWLSDNQRLLYGDDRKILVVDMLSGQVNEILTLHHGRVGSMVSVSADDEWIYFVHVLEEADIWMLEFDPES